MITIRIGENIQNYRDEIVKHTSALIKIRSIQEEAQPGMPFGQGVHQALIYMLNLADSMGFKTSNVDGYAGHAEYGEGSEMAAVLVHLDTVGLGKGWSVPPLSGIIKDGRIYGRGAFDDKGPAVVALYALKTLKDLNIMPNRRIRVIFGTNEETGMADMDYYFDKEPLPDMAFCPDAGYPIFNVELGSVNLWIQDKEEHSVLIHNLEVIEGGPYGTFHPDPCKVRLRLASAEAAGAVCLSQGSSSFRSVQKIDAHLIELTTSGYNESPNAIVNMIDWLSQLESYDFHHPLLKFLHTQIGRDTDGRTLEIHRTDEVSGATQVYIKQLHCTPDKFAAIINIRYPVSSSGDELIAVFNRKLDEYGLTAKVVRHLYPVYVSPEHPVIQKLSIAYEKMTGEKAVLLKMGAGTYSRKLRNNGVAFGSGLRDSKPTNVHQADEHIIIDDLMKHAEICLQGMYELIQ